MQVFFPHLPDHRMKSLKVLRQQNHLWHPCPLEQLKLQRSLLGRFLETLPGTFTLALIVHINLTLIFISILLAPRRQWYIFLGACVRKLSKLSLPAVLCARERSRTSVLTSSFAALSVVKLAYCYRTFDLHGLKHKPKKICKKSKDIKTNRCVVELV